MLGAAAIAAGAGDAGMGIMQAGQRAALGEMLAFTRAQEATADATGSRLLSKAGISGKGMLDFFSKLQNQEYRLAIYSKDSFDQTHPLSSERIQALRAEAEERSRHGASRSTPALEARFQRVKAKLLGYRRSQAGGRPISRKRPERAGALRARLRLSPRRLSG